MELKELLEHLEELEEELSKLYLWFSHIFADDSEACRLFTKMSREEAIHRDLVRKNSALLTGKTKFAEPDLSVDDLVSMIEDVKKLRGKDQAPSLEQALKLAIVFEHDSAEYYYIKALAEVNPNFKQMADNLSSANRDHKKTLLKLSHNRGFIPPYLRQRRK